MSPPSNRRTRPFVATNSSPDSPEWNRWTLPTDPRYDSDHLEPFDGASARLLAGSCQEYCDCPDVRASCTLSTVRSSARSSPTRGLLYDAARATRNECPGSGGLVSDAAWIRPLLQRSSSQGTPRLMTRDDPHPDGHSAPASRVFTQPSIWERPLRRPNGRHSLGTTNALRWGTQTRQNGMENPGRVP